VDDRRVRKDDAIVVAVVGLLESDGYDAVQLRVVAQQAHVSLRTIYKYFPTRDELILAAVERWMQEHAYSGLAEPPPRGSLYERLMWGLRHIFEPWESNPRMLEAFHRARIAPGGERLHAQGFATAGPVMEGLLDGLDPGYAEDLGLLLTLIVRAAIARFVDGDLAITDILRVLERAVFRLTADNAAAAAARSRRGRGARRGSNTSAAC
jgi:AcrR family transcriptional regulator